MRDIVGGRRVVRSSEGQNVENDTSVVGMPFHQSKLQLRSDEHEREL